MAGNERIRQHHVVVQRPPDAQRPATHDDAIARLAVAIHRFENGYGTHAYDSR